MSANGCPFPYEQPHPPFDPEAGRNVRPPRDPEPQPGPPPGREEEFVHDGQLIHLGFTVHPGKKRRS